MKTALLVNYLKFVVSRRWIYVRVGYYTVRLLASKLQRLSVVTEAEFAASYHHIQLVASDKQHSPLCMATIPFMKCVLPSVQFCFCYRLKQAICTSHSWWLCAQMFQGRNCYSLIYRQTALYLRSYVTHNYKFLASFCSSVCIIIPYKSNNGVWEICGRRWCLK